MRIARLDLTRYGHFTDKRLTLPRSEQDLHVLVGPNEAGKSTLRNAVLDLLFGIETRSRFNFRHAYSEMRLGALLEQEGEVLDFQRVKGRGRTLRDPEDGVLPDAALAPFTGDRVRDFFEQMFGLDHDRLVQGGQDILDAGSDLGQILFQASAGIEGFGNLRDALEAEADKLWARRKSSDREYYIAAAELDEAKAALKASTVHTKVWTEAHQAVEQLRQEADELHARAEELAQRRSRLERARRTAPVLQRLREQEAALNALGQVRLLPEEAANRLQEAERIDALAASARRLHEAQAAAKTEARDAIHIDAALLAREQDIQALAAGREQVRHHAADVDKRREEARAHWKLAAANERGAGLAQANP